MKFLFVNALLAVLLLGIPTLLLRFVPDLPLKYGFVITIITFVIAALFLDDFGRRTGDEVLPETINVSRSFQFGVRHSSTFVLWAIIMNSYWSVGFGALLTQTKGFAAVPAAVWMMTYLLVSVVMSLWRQGWHSVLKQLTPELMAALVATVVACILFQVHLSRVSS